MTTHHTFAEFQQALMNAEVPAYAWGGIARETDYHPCWLAPTGHIVWGNSHSEIARDTCGSSEYERMFDQGYLRLEPYYRRDGFAIQGRGGTITPAMRVTLAKLLQKFKPSKGNEKSYVAVESGEYQVVHSVKEFLAACLASYGD